MKRFTLLLTLFFILCLSGCVTIKITTESAEIEKVSEPVFTEKLWRYQSGNKLSLTGAASGGYGIIVTDSMIVRAEGSEWENIIASYNHDGTGRKVRVSDIGGKVQGCTTDGTNFYFFTDDTGNNNIRKYSNNWSLLATASDDRSSERGMFFYNNLLYVVNGHNMEARNPSNLLRETDQDFKIKDTGDHLDAVTFDTDRNELIVANNIEQLFFINPSMPDVYRREYSRETRFGEIESIAYHNNSLWIQGTVPYLQTAVDRLIR